MRSGPPPWTKTPSRPPTEVIVAIWEPAGWCSIVVVRVTLSAGAVTTSLTSLTITTVVTRRMSTPIAITAINSGFAFCTVSLRGPIMRFSPVGMSAG